MAYTKDALKKAFIQIDDAYKVAIQGNPNGYKTGMAKAFGTLAGVDDLPNADYVGNFLAPLFEGIDEVSKNANRPGLAASTHAQVLQVHEKAQGALLGPYITNFGSVPAQSDKEKEQAKVKKNLQDIIAELSEPTKSN